MATSGPARAHVIAFIHAASGCYHSTTTLRYPSGQASFELSESSPKVGDVLKRNGDDWVVTEILKEKDGSTMVVLRPGLKPA